MRFLAIQFTGKGKNIQQSMSIRHLQTNDNISVNANNTAAIKYLRCNKIHTPMVNLSKRTSHYVRKQKSNSQLFSI